MSKEEEQAGLLQHDSIDLEAQIPAVESTSGSQALLNPPSQTPATLLGIKVNNPDINEPSKSHSEATSEGSDETEDTSQHRRPRLRLLLAGYYLILLGLVSYAIALLVTLYSSQKALHYKWYRDWYPSLWIATIACLGLSVHLTFSVKKCFAHGINPPEIAQEPDSTSPYAHLFNFGQPEVYSRIQTHVFALFVFFLLWSTLAFELTSIMPQMAVLPWGIAIISLASDVILYSRAWKIIEIHPTWTHTHIGDLDRITGAGQVRL